MADAGELRSAVILPVLEAAAAVDSWRERTCSDKPSTGVPAHVTLLFPFIPALELDDEAISALRKRLSSVRTFSFQLRATGRFSNTIYLRPEPATPFVDLIETLVEQFPDYPPYGDAFGSVVPHVTVAQGDDELMDKVQIAVEPFLPIEARAEVAVLLEEVVPHSGGWKTRVRLPLG